MEGALILLVLLAMGSRKKGPGNGKPKPKPKGKPQSTAGDPPGGCRKVWSTPAATVEALNMLGYSPMPSVFGPDGKLGTGDAVPDVDVERFQRDYNDASAQGILGPKAGGLVVDGLMGRCTMAGMDHATRYVGPAVWRELFPAVEVTGLPTG